MVFRPNAESRQDMPPKGGYPKAQISRINNPRGPSGYVIFGAFFAAIVIGNYFIYATNKENREINDRNNAMRKVLFVYFEAEKDILMSEAVSLYKIPGYDLSGVINLPKQKRYVQPTFRLNKLRLIEKSESKTH